MPPTGLQSTSFEIPSKGSHIRPFQALFIGGQLLVPLVQSVNRLTPLLILQSTNRPPNGPKSTSFEIPSRGQPYETIPSTFRSAGNFRFLWSSRLTDYAPLLILLSTNRPPNGPKSASFEISSRGQPYKTNPSTFHRWPKCRSQKKSQFPDEVLFAPFNLYLEILSAE